MGKIATVNLAGGIFLCFSMIAAPSHPSNPYASIIERNVFGLCEPPPQPVTLPAPVASDSAEFMLTGIVDFRLAKWALLTRTERGKPPQRYTLSVGQKEGDLQVLDIDAETATVRVRHGVAEVVLSFDTHGPPNAAKIEDLGRKYVQQSKPFVDAHTQAHALREKREQERRAIERAAAAAELAAQQISTWRDDPQ